MKANGNVASADFGCALGCHSLIRYCFFSRESRIEFDLSVCVLPHVVPCSFKISPVALHVTLFGNFRNSVSGSNLDSSPTFEANFDDAPVFEANFDQSPASSQVVLKEIVQLRIFFNRESLCTKRARWRRGQGSCATVVSSTRLSMR